MAAAVLFKWIVCSTVMATLLVFLVLFVKLVFRDKLGARWHYIIWMLVLLKLLIPFGPQSQLSIFNLFNITDRAITEKSYDVMDKISTATTNIVKSTPIPCFDAPVKKDAPSGAHEPDKTLYLSILGLFIWFTGASLVGIHICKSNLKSSNELDIGNPVEDPDLLDYLKECREKIGIKRDIIIKGVSNLKTPALYGILNPVLLIPFHMLQGSGTKQVKYAIYHELAHLKRRDIPMNIFLSFLVVVHWFNPFIWYAFYKIRQDSEFACDELVLSCLKPSEQKEYGLTLIGLIEKFSSNIKLLNAVGFLGSKTLIKKRITAIAYYKKRSLKLSVFTVFIFIVLVLAAFTNAVENLNIGTKAVERKNNPPVTITAGTNISKNTGLVHLKQL